MDSDGINSLEGIFSARTVLKIILYIIENHMSKILLQFHYV